MPTVLNRFASVDFRLFRNLARLGQSPADHESHVLLSAGDPQGINAPADRCPTLAAK